MMHSQLITKSFAAFSNEPSTPPSITLRGGNALDDYNTPPSFDPIIDLISDNYFEKYSWGISYLDASSWRHYLPHLIEYAIRHIQNGTLVVDSLLNSLRPPDLDPPRLASLTTEQEAVITEFLDLLAFDQQSAHQELACQVLEEWWTPGALYRGINE